MPESVVLTEVTGAGAFIVSEANGNRSRDNVTITVAADTVLKAGTVLGMLATNKYVPYDNAGSDGSESARAILYSAVVNDGDAPADRDGVVLNGDCEVSEGDLIWDAGVDAAGKAAAAVDLRVHNIKIRPIQ